MKIACNIMNLIKYIIVILLINLSGNPALTANPNNRIFFVGYFLFLLFISIYYKKYLLKKNVVFIYLLLLIFIIQIFTIYRYFAFSGTIFMFLKIVSGIIAINFVGKDFFKIYWNILIFYCAISLLGFLFNYFEVILPFLPYNNGGVDNLRVSSILYTQLLNLSNGALTIRNSGPFWEPGVFQIYINIGFLFLLIDKSINPHKISKLICIIALLTTFSTTGYICFFLIIVLYIFKQNEAILNKIFYSIPFLILFLILFFNIDFLSSKISNDKNRTYLGVSEIIENNPLFGLGYNPDSFLKVNKSTANSIVGIVRNIGFFGLILYFTFIFRNFKKNRLEIIIFILIISSEPIFMYPFVWGIPFLYYNKYYKINHNYNSEKYITNE